MLKRNLRNLATFFRNFLEKHTFASRKNGSICPKKNGITQVQQFWNTWLFWLSTYLTEHRLSISTRTLNNIYQLSITRYPKLQVDSNIHKISVVQWKNSNSKHQFCIENAFWTTGSNVPSSSWYLKWHVLMCAITCSDFGRVYVQNSGVRMFRIGLHHNTPQFWTQNMFRIGMCWSHTS